MTTSGFMQRQVSHIRTGGWSVLRRKVARAARLLSQFPLYFVAAPLLLVMRATRAWLVIRIGRINSSRIGHFAGNTELYLCEKDAGINVPDRAHWDVFYFANRPICNETLGTMWKRSLRIGPAWILGPVAALNRIVPGGAVHEISNTQSDRDVNNLLDRFPPHLEFTAEEQAAGEAGMKAIGIPHGAPFVCLIVRDNAYLDSQQPGDWSYHDYRNSSIQNYVMAVEELARRGYYVLRMGAKVNEPIRAANPKVIDYATNGMRTDFMDIFLGAKCQFCISVGTGFDAVPYIFRRPIVYVNMVPLGYLFTFRNNFVGITKHHLCAKSNRRLSLSEIFSRKVGFSLCTADYQTSDVRLVENTPHEIRDAVIEMDERVRGTWRQLDGDEDRQRHFWRIFPADAVDPYHGRPLHGEIRASIGASFLRNNDEWLH